MHLKHFMKRSVALALVLALIVPLCACDAESATKALNEMASSMGFSTEVDVTQRLPNSPWINSDLEGSITEDTQLNLKDDFHAAVNRDWFLENNTEGDETLYFWTPVIDALYKNQLALFQRNSTFEPDPKVMSKESHEHLLDLLRDMEDLASDQEKRNELGVEPLRPYVEAIENIDSLDALTQYLKNTDKTNISGEDFVNFYVSTPLNSRDFYTVFINYPVRRTLQDYGNYFSVGFDQYYVYQLEKTAIEHVLGQLGYTPKEISKLLNKCYSFERMISSMLPTNAEIKEDNYLNRSNKIYTLEDIAKMQGNFPLTELLESAGIAHSDSFRVMEPAFLEFFGTYYKEKNLDTLKAYLMVHNILDSLPYLDETCQAMADKVKVARDTQHQNPPAPVAPEDPADEEAMEQYRLKMLNYEYIDPLLSEAYQLAYIGSYCSSETKEQITQMVNDILDYYVELLDNTEWLSQQTRALAIEKVQKTAVRIMYPDVLPDYSSLVYGNYEEGGNLLDAVAAINQFRNAPDAAKVNQPVRRSDWNLASMSTVEINAYNDPSTNCIVILAGILAGDAVFDADAPVEVNYGRLGAVIGHEVTHSFDTTGYRLDSEGLPYGWWTNDDEVAFRLRSDKLANFYSKLIYLPESTLPYEGNKVQSEAISDMGGVKCMLALAEEIPDFDYDLFFRSFASMWVYQTSYAVELERAGDVHPLGFYRTNITLQQFDKFFETYGIGPGDGMYLAPEDRILVW